MTSFSLSLVAGMRDGGQRPYPSGKDPVSQPPDPAEQYHADQQADLRADYDRGFLDTEDEG